MIHPVLTLFEKLDKTFPQYPQCMVPVPWRDGVIEGTAFFPGGYGLVKEPNGKIPAWPEGKIMVIGNDWGNEASFLAARRARSELTGSTWRGILSLHGTVFNLRDSFFTNAFTGLRKDHISSVGECPGRKDAMFKKRCRDFLGEQLRTQKPRLIFTLGKYAPDMLSGLFTSALSGWNSDKPTWNEIDRFGPLHEGITLDRLPGYQITVCALTHPDRGYLNYGRRAYDVFGDELGLIKAALESVEPFISAVPRSQFD